MPKLTADEVHVWHVQEFLDEHPELRHVRPRRRGDTITLESGPKGDVVPHARIRRVTAQCWMLELPDHQGRWGVVPELRAPIRQVLETLLAQFPWSLTSRE